MTYIDPVQAAPNNYRLIDENDRVRVVEMTLNAGQSDVLHSHKSETVFFISGGKVKINIPGADSIEADIPDGHVMFSDPWTHQVHNQGDKDVRAILIEHKD
jgi:mannose-6-phosphate isomerase-like protein (cupin superfamily)